MVSTMMLRRAASVTERNVTLFRTARSYAWLVVSGFAEPVLYLVAMGWGVGALVGAIPLPDGRVVSYLTFLAPAMLAASTMNGALAESTINFFAKMSWKFYDSIINTPVNPAEIAFGELAWAMIRGVLYSAGFLMVMTVLGMTSPELALVALPAALLVGLAFGGLGLAFSTYMRDWQDFEYLGIVQFALFVFSGTFVPVSSYPAPLQFVVQLTPLYHGVELIRGITLGQLGAGLLGHTAYLLVVVVLGLTFAARRMRHLFRK